MYGNSKKWQRRQEGRRAKRITGRDREQGEEKKRDGETDMYADRNKETTWKKLKRAVIDDDSSDRNKM